MKGYACLLVLLILIVSDFSKAADDMRLYIKPELARLLKEYERDPKLRIQRSAALHFHRLINKYRKSKKLDTLKWNDDLWLAALNHCTWMIEHNNLTHTQIPDTKFFSGKMPSDRITFVNEKAVEGYGENALYNSAGINSSYNGEDIAKSAFEQWKASKGHDENMRGEGYSNHGVAFVLTESLCWAVDVFSYDNFEENNLFASSIGSNNNTKSVNKTKDVDKTKAVSLGNKDVDKTKTVSLENINVSNETTMKPQAVMSADQWFLREFKKQFPQKDASKKNRLLRRSTNMHAQYMLLNQTDDDTEIKDNKGFYGKTPKQRLIRVSGYTLLFIKTPVETCIYREYNLGQSDNKEQFEQLIQDISQLTDKSNIVVMQKQKKKKMLKVAVVISRFE